MYKRQYLRIAPELYLKRLLVGGFDKVYEINRSFRNEGLSTRHNPEFTMLEWYEAFASMQDQMDLTKEIIENAAYAIGVEKILMWGDLEINLENFSYQKLTDLVLQHNPKISKEQINDKNVLLNYTNELNLKIEESWGYGRLLLEIFESTVEDKLIDPTFVTEYPVEVSPLSLSLIHI